MDLALIAVACLSFVAVVAALAGLRAVLGGRTDAVLARVERLTHGEAPGAAEPTTRGPSWLTGLVRGVGRRRGGEESREQLRLRTQLIQAGLREEHALTLLFAAKVAFAVLLAILPLGLSALRQAPLAHVELLTLLCAGIGFYAPNVWLSRRVRARRVEIGRALPDALDLLVTCVEAGLGLEAAFQRITDEIELSAPLLGAELRQTAREMQAGMSRGEAFRRLAERTGLEELRTLAVILVQSEMFGTSIGRSLRIHAAAMRMQRTHRAEQAAATVSVKLMLPLVLCILPSLLVVILGPAVVRIVHVLIPALERH